MPAAEVAGGPATGGVYGPVVLILGCGGAPPGAVIKGFPN